LYWVVLAPRARAWGLIWLALAGLISLATLPLTIVQLQALFGFGERPLRLDYLVLLWSVVPWWWRHPDPLWYLRPSRWPGIAARFREALATARQRWSSDRQGSIASARRRVRLQLREFLGLEASG
jgi:hypothetical protein